jgi:transcriptional regulator with XRE-family HTH domain
MKENFGKGEVLKSLLGLNIKRFRVNSGYTLEELAEKAGISVPFLGAIERGEKWPSPSTLAGIAQGLDVNPYDLLKPEAIASQDIKKITSKLIRDITALVNRSIKMMNTVVREYNRSDK